MPSPNTAPTGEITMSAVIIEHVNVFDLPEAWRAKLPAPSAARVTVRIEEEAPTPNKGGSYSFLDLAQRLSIDAPADFSTSYEDLIAPRI